MNTFVAILITVFVSTSLVVIALGWAYFVIKSVKLRTSEVKLPIDKEIEILKLEFDYAKATAMQATDDRFKLVNFYLGLVAGIFTLGFGLGEVLDNDYKSLLGLMFLIVGFSSLIFTIFLVRLRQAWIESLKSMNKIKEYFVEKNLDLKKYLLWDNSKLPKPEKLKTLSFFSNLLIASVGSGIGFVGFYLLNLELEIAMFISLFYLLLNMWLYYFMLKLNQ